MKFHFVTTNPYLPPITQENTVVVLADAASDDIVVPRSRIGNGPSVVICLGGICGIMISSALLGTSNLVHLGFADIGRNRSTIAILSAMGGWIIGGIAFRLISSRWPSDPKVRRRQVVVSLFAVSIPPSVVFYLFDANHLNLVALSVGLGVSIAAAVWISGNRRQTPTPLASSSVVSSRSGT